MTINNSKKNAIEIDTKSIINRYKNRINNIGLNYKSMNSGSQLKQNLRHKVHASSIITDNPSILDIGCGIGQFNLFLRNIIPKFKYTGYDVVDEYIALCKSKELDGDFYVRNVLIDGINEKYDI